MARFVVACLGVVSLLAAAGPARASKCTAGLAPCCEGLTSGPLVDACAVSPMFLEPNCTSLGGTFHPAAACRADQLCHD
jgi:hypothetical protein